MPIPLILGVAAGVVGARSAIHGASEIKDANEKMKAVRKRHERNEINLRCAESSAVVEMDFLGMLELEIAQDFENFSNVIEKIQNRPQFKKYEKEDIPLPSTEELKKLSEGVKTLLAGLGGAAAGVAAGYAASGVTTSVVMGLGTGTTISSLNGAALTNATLAALGGGAVSAEGGVIALGSTILGAATLGVGLLVGGIVFNVTGNKLSDKVDEARLQVIEAEKKIEIICNYLEELKGVAIKYSASLKIVRDKYRENFRILSCAVNGIQKIDWNDFSERQKRATENVVLLVGLLHKMCQVNLVNKAESEYEMNTINEVGINEALQTSESVLENAYQEVVFEETDDMKDYRWKEVKNRLRIIMASDIYDEYIKDIMLFSETDEKLKVQAVNREAALYIKNNCHTVLKEIVKDVYGCDMDISYGFC